MRLVFFSLTGQTKRFIDKLGMAEQAIKLTNSGQETVAEEFILFCPTYEAGVEFVDDFLDDHKHLLKGIVGSGNRNFGPDFCHLAKTYAKHYQVPLLHIMEFSGTAEDVAFVKGIIENES